jgi:hypothetical protein
MTNPEPSSRSRARDVNPYGAAARALRPIFFELPARNLRPVPNLGLPAGI